jgi:hypothetical protein
LKFYKCTQKSYWLKTIGKTNLSFSTLLSYLCGKIQFATIRLKISKIGFLFYAYIPVHRFHFLNIFSKKRDVFYQLTGSWFDVLRQEQRSFTCRPLDKAGIELRTKPLYIYEAENILALSLLVTERLHLIECFSTSHGILKIKPKDLRSSN